MSDAMADDRPTIPHVLFVDDNELIDPSAIAELFEPLGVATRLRHPEETIDTDLEWAHLVVVDYFLQNWEERDRTESVARSPRDGLAAVASMRSMLLPPLADRHAGTLPSRPVAFAVWSGNLGEATFGLPSVVLPHVFSRDNGLEWTFDRSDLQTLKGRQNLQLLANAVSWLSEHWRNLPGDSEARLLRVLGFAQVDASDQARAWWSDAARDALDCRPPLNELGDRSNGLSLLRWLLHRILPYPCFLLDERELCARLRVDSLSTHGHETSALIEELQTLRYAGLLAGFDGPRWWRAGIEDWLFTVSDGEPGNSRIVAELALERGASRSTEWLRPVPVIGGDLARRSDFVEVEATLRVRPDDWPVYADDAFSTLEDAAEDPYLRMLVEPADRELLALYIGRDDDPPI